MNVDKNKSEWLGEYRYPERLVRLARLSFIALSNYEKDAS